MNASIRTHNISRRISNDPINYLSRSELARGRAWANSRMFWVDEMPTERPVAIQPLIDSLMSSDMLMNDEGDVYVPSEEEYCGEV